MISGGDGSVGGDGDGSVGADNATAMGSGVVYNGAGQVVSGGSGFGDSHSTYTGATRLLSVAVYTVWQPAC